MGRILRFLRAFAKDRHGNIALTFGLTAIPAMMIAGFAVDYSRTQSSSNQIQAALDGAVLAAAVEMQSSSSTNAIQTVGANYFNAVLSANNVVAICDPSSYTPNFVDHKVVASVTCKQPATLSTLLGVTDLPFTRHAETSYGVGKLDVAFMFDTSGSMGSENRMKDLKKAAKEAVSIILDSKVKDPTDVRIAFSTYATSVNVGTTYFKSVTNQDPNKSECSYWYWYYGQKYCGQWTQVSKTCVTGREGTAKYTDAAPGAGTWIDYETTSCNAATITPLTNNKTILEAAINSLPTSGTTAGHLGIAWSWYLLSPNWKSIWPVASEPKPYDEPDLTKVAVLMTDGSFNKDYMSGGNSFDHAKKFCDAMKAKKIEIYTVAFKAPSQGKNILNYCASNSGQAFTASNGAELTDAYKKIATSISDLRLSK